MEAKSQINIFCLLKPFLFYSDLLAHPFFLEYFFYIVIQSPLLFQSGQDIEGKGWDSRSESGGRGKAWLRVGGRGEDEGRGHNESESEGGGDGEDEGEGGRGGTELRPPSNFQRSERGGQPGQRWHFQGEIGILNLQTILAPDIWEIWNMIALWCIKSIPHCDPLPFLLKLLFCQEKIKCRGSKRH